MADSSRTKRRRLTLIGSAAAALALSVSLAPGAVAGPPGSPPGAAKAAAATQQVDVMTRNLYLGASLDAVIAALESGEAAAIVDAATNTWNTVVASDPAERMAAIADEIREEAPAVVGLQEVTIWSTYPYNPTPPGSVVGPPTEVYDFLDLLLDELNQPGGPTYYEVANATAENFESPPIPILADASAGYPTLAVELQDRDVILARSDVQATNGRHGNFRTILELPDGTDVDRGWGSADINVAGVEFRFVNAHTEAWGPEELREAQVMELFAAQEAIDGLTGDLPDVYVGDYNTAAPAAGAYVLLTEQLEDALRGKSARGQATCCQNATLTNMGNELDKRIDLVLTSDDIKATRVVRTGTTPLDLPGDTRWASDHAGVVARLMFTG